MEFSRRDLAWLLPALGAAQTEPPKSKTLSYEDLPVKVNGENRQRAILNTKTHGDFPVEIHETELAAGQAPHPPHEHAHEEMVLIREGTLEVTISGKSTTLGAGSVVWVASNEHHGWRNTGSTRARYFVLALGRA